MNLLPALTHKRLFQLCVAFSLFVTLALAVSFTPGEKDEFRVFGSYWASGQAASQGLNPYAVYPLTWITPFDIVDLNLNPPTVLPLLELVAKLEPTAAAFWWTICGSILFIAAVYVLVINCGYAGQRRQLGWIFIAPAFFDVLFLGQIYCFLFVLAVGAWMLLERKREVAAGILIGIFVAAKPNFGVWLLFLLLAGHWRVAISGGIAGLALVGISASLYGIDVYSQWLTAIRADSHAAQVYTEVSIHGYMTRLGLPVVGTFISAALLIGSAWWVWRQRFNVLEASKLALVVAILASPLAWFHYTLFLVPALVQQRWNQALSAAALLLLIPVSIPIKAMLGPQWLAPIGGGIYFTAVCLIFAAFVLEIKSARSTQLKHDSDVVTVGA